MWLFGVGRLLMVCKGQRRKGGLPGWRYLNQAPDVTLLAMSSENEFCSVSLSCLMSYTGADFSRVCSTTLAFGMQRLGPDTGRREAV